MLKNVGRIVGADIRGLGGRIVSRRETLGLSQLDLVERINARRRKSRSKQKPLQQPAMSLYEHDTRIPSAAALVELADALECSVDYLLGRIATPEIGGLLVAAAAAGQDVEAAFTAADREGKASTTVNGKVYVKRRGNWEPLP